MLVLANLRDRWTAFLAAFLAILTGVALVTATLLVYEGSRPRVQPRVAGAAALVLPPRAHDVDGAARDSVPWGAAEAGALAERLRRAPGVDRVVVDRSFYAQPFLKGEPVADAGAAEAGHGWQSAGLAPYRLMAGRAPVADDEVVAGRALGVPVGGELTVNLVPGRRAFRVVGTVDGPGLYFGEAYAARRQAGVTVLGLLAERGASGEAVARAARDVLAGDVLARDGGGARVVSGSGRSAVQPAWAEHRRFLGTQLVTALAALGLFTTVFVVASTLALTTGLRRRDLGLLRMIGASPRQVRRMVLGEAGVLGLLGAAAGTALGVAAAPPLLGVLRGLDVVPPDAAVRLAAWPLSAGAVTGVGVALLSAWSASRTAARVAPAEALTDLPAAGRAGRGRRHLGGWVVLALGAGGAVLTALAGAERRLGAAIGTTMLLVAAAALLAPLCVAPLGRLLTAPFARSRRALPVLVRAGLGADPRRAAALAAPVIAVAGFAVLLTGMVQTMRVAYPAEQTRQLAGQLIVTPEGTAGNTDEVVATYPVGRAALPTRAFVGSADEAAASRVVLDVLGSRDPRWDRPGQAVLGARTARDLGVRAGQWCAVRFADGATVRLRIARVLPEDPARGGFVVARALVREHDPAALTDDVFVPASARSTVARAGAVIPGTAVRDAEAYARADYARDARLTDALATMLLVVTVGYAGIAVVNSTVTAAHRRRRELRVLGAAGGTARQLLLCAAAETALVVTVGAVLGLLASLPPLAGMASGLAGATSTGVGLQVDGAAVTAVTAGCAALAVVSGVLVTWRLLRGRAAVA